MFLYRYEHFDSIAVVQKKKKKDKFYIISMYSE